jgi:hypothetical protein
MGPDDMFKLATGWLGISAAEYYSMTPRELQLMCDGYVERYRQTIEMQAVAVHVGMVNANGRKKHRVFKKDAQTGTITKEEKAEILSDLKERLLGSKDVAIS